MAQLTPGSQFLSNVIVIKAIMAPLEYRLQFPSNNNLENHRHSRPTLPPRNAHAHVHHTPSSTPYLTYVSHHLLPSHPCRGLASSPHLERSPRSKSIPEEGAVSTCPPRGRGYRGLPELRLRFRAQAPGKRTEFHKEAPRPHALPRVSVTQFRYGYEQRGLRRQRALRPNHPLRSKFDGHARFKRGYYTRTGIAGP